MKSVFVVAFLLFIHVGKFLYSHSEWVLIAFPSAGTYISEQELL